MKAGWRWCNELQCKIRADAMRLNPIDDALFIKMAEKLDFCQEILRVFLGDNQLIVLENVPQNIVKNLQGCSCILDLTSNACFPY